MVVIELIEPRQKNFSPSRLPMLICCNEEIERGFLFRQVHKDVYAISLELVLSERELYIESLCDVLTGFPDSL